MDVVLLIVQCLLVILLIVIPLFSGYDKWQRWKPARKVLAVALGAGIAVVAFTQYRKLVFLHKADLPSAFGGFEHHRRGPWYTREVSVFPVEYLISVLAGTVLLVMAVQAGKKGRYGQCFGFGLLFAGLLTVSLSLKLRLWH